MKFLRFGGLIFSLNLGAFWLTELYTMLRSNKSCKLNFLSFRLATSSETSIEVRISAGYWRSFSKPKLAIQYGGPACQHRVEKLYTEKLYSSLVSFLCHFISRNNSHVQLRPINTLVCCFGMFAVPVTEVRLDLKGNEISIQYRNNLLKSKR